MARPHTLKAQYQKRADESVRKIFGEHLGLKQQCDKIANAICSAERQDISVPSDTYSGGYVYKKSEDYIASQMMGRKGELYPAINDLLRNAINTLETIVIDEREMSPKPSMADHRTSALGSYKSAYAELQKLNEAYNALRQQGDNIDIDKMMDYLLMQMDKQHGLQRKR